MESVVYKQMITYSFDGELLQDPHDFPHGVGIILIEAHLLVFTLEVSQKSIKERQNDNVFVKQHL